MKNTLSAALLLANIISQSAHAQSTTGSVSGTVVDSESGETLIGVNVVLEGTLKGTATDIDGKYALKSVEPGIYTLIVLSLIHI